METEQASCTPIPSTTPLATATSITKKNASLRNQPELIMIRHKDIGWVVDNLKRADIDRHVKESAEMCRRATAKFWGPENPRNQGGRSTYNQHLMGRFSMTKSDLSQAILGWTIGYLRYYKPEAGKRSSADGRMYRYLYHRFLELLRHLKKKVQDCAPEVPAYAQDDYQQASMSEASHGLDEKRGCTCKPKQRKPCRWCRTQAKAKKMSVGAQLQILERLAVYTHPQAIELLQGQAEDASDGRSQVAKLISDLTTCTGGASGCKVCEVRRREPDRAVCSPPKSRSLAEVRLWLEDFLEVSREYQKLRAKEQRRLGHRDSAHVLGLVAENSNRSFSPTRLAYDLLATARGSAAESTVFVSLINDSPTATRLPDDSTIKRWRASAKLRPEGSTKMAKSKSTTIADVAANIKKPEKREPKSYPAIRVVQGGRTFYKSVIPIDDLFRYSFIDRQADNTEQGYQRKLDARRAQRIAEYLVQPGASIPGDIVLSASDSAKLTFSGDSDMGSISFQFVQDAFAVLDGQHRLWGHQKCVVRNVVPVTIYVGLDVSAEARLFLDINNECKGVPRALLLSIKGIAGTENEMEAERRELFKKLLTDPHSPAKDYLQVGTNKQGKLSRSSFDYSVSRAQRTSSYAGIPKDSRYEVISNYIRAFSVALEDQTLLGRRYYFAAMFEMFGEVLVEAKRSKHRSIKAEALQEVINRIANAPGKVERDFISSMRGLISGTSIGAEDV